MMKTKSIRLSEEESRLIETLSKAEKISEASLMKRLIAEGIAAYRLWKAIEAYLDKEADLSTAAAIAGISTRKMMAELEKREIPIYSVPEMFEEGLRTLATTFKDKRLAKLVKR
jgi:predicted HTH domain antitoxin